MLPLGASAVMLGFGFVIAFDEGIIDFRSAPWIVPVVQALVAIPFVVRIVVPTLRAIDVRQREAAALLGASPARVRRESTSASPDARSRLRRLRLRDLARGNSERPSSSRVPTLPRCPSRSSASSVGPAS